MKLIIALNILFAGAAHAQENTQMRLYRLEQTVFNLNQRVQYLESTNAPRVPVTLWSCSVANWDNGKMSIGKDVSKEAAIAMANNACIAGARHPSHCRAAVCEQITQ